MFKVTRLLKKINNTTTRLSLKKIARWNPIDMKSGNPLQVLTDAMSYGATVQINYKNNGWRTILPYGWNSSKDGNILLMCYKDTGEIRSYRMDKIYDLLIDDNLLNEMPGDRPEEPAMHMDFNDFKIPTLPNIDEIIDETENEDNEELPYDAGLQALTDNEVKEDYQPVNTINDEEEDQQNEEDLEQDEVEDNNEEEENENNIEEGLNSLDDFFNNDENIDESSEDELIDQDFTDDDDNEKENANAVTLRSGKPLVEAPT